MLGEQPILTSLSPSLAQAQAEAIGPLENKKKKHAEKYKRGPGNYTPPQAQQLVLRK